MSTRGLEADLIARPTDNWSLAGGFAYTDAKIDSFRVPPGAPASQVIPDGTQLTSAPKFKASLTSNTDVETGWFANLFFGGSISYQSKQLTQLSPDPIVRAATTVDSYALADVQAGLVDPDERWKLSFLVRNLFDQSFAAAIQTGGPGGSYRFQRPREADRYYGLSLRVNFGGQ